MRNLGTEGTMRKRIQSRATPNRSTLRAIGGSKTQSLCERAVVEALKASLALSFMLNQLECSVVACRRPFQFARGSVTTWTYTRGLPERAAARSLQASPLVLTLPHCHIKNSAYSVFCRTPICINYSKAALPHIASILLKVFGFELLLFFFYVPPNLLFYYRKSILYSPL